MDLCLFDEAILNGVTMKALPSVNVSNMQQTNDTTLRMKFDALRLKKLPKA